MSTTEPILAAVTEDDARRLTVMAEDALEKKSTNVDHLPPEARKQARDFLRGCMRSVNVFRQAIGVPNRYSEEDIDNLDVTADHTFDMVLGHMLAQHL